MWTKQRSRKLVAWLMVFVLITVAAFLYMEYRLKPIVLQMAEARIQAEGGRALNDAVMDCAQEGILYSDLVNIHYDTDGRVTLLEANTLAMNKLATQISLNAQERIARIGVQGLSVPLGTAFGSQLLAGKGPAVRVQIMPVGSVAPEFGTEFVSAGINQVRHRIFLKVKATMRIVLPAGSRTVEVGTQVPIAETVIVGNVPDTFFEMLQGQSSLEDWVPK